MSDEHAPPPPALRLKPRLRPPGEQAPAGVPAAGELPAFTPTPPAADEVAAATPPATPPAAPKIRFKPRLATPVSDATAATPATEAPAAFVPAPEVPLITPPSAVANPHVVAPAPEPFVAPPMPAVSAPALVPDPPAPAAPAASSTPSEGGKFKLKPKLPSLEPAPSASVSLPVPAAPPLVAPPPVQAPPAAPPVLTAKPPVFPSPKPPPFPVAKSPPPVPPAVEPASVEAPAAGKSRRTNPILIRLAALVVVGAGLFFAWKYFAPGAAAPAPEPKAPVAAPTAKQPPAAEEPTAPLTPSDTLNQLAHVPANAINRAREVIDARAESGQTRIDATTIGEDLTTPAPATPVAKAPATSEPQPAATPVASKISPGVAATSAQVQAVAEASPAFRTFVASAKVSGVFQGPPTRAMINGRLTRAGEVIDATLGITFTGVDSPRRLLIFVDRSGATVTRRF